jgi:hypothetical protein
MEGMMVDVIDREEEAAGAPCVVFHVYTRPNRPEPVLGAVLFGAPTDERAYRWDAGELGTPVAAALERALGFAQMHGVPFVRVDDPQGLFPPESRGGQSDQHPRGRKGRGRARRRGRNGGPGAQASSAG